MKQNEVKTNEEKNKPLANSIVYEWIQGNCTNDYLFADQIYPHLYRMSLSFSFKFKFNWYGYTADEVAAEMTSYLTHKLMNSYDPSRETNVMLWCHILLSQYVSGRITYNSRQKRTKDVDSLFYHYKTLNEEEYNEYLNNIHNPLFLNYVWDYYNEWEGLLFQKEKYNIICRVVIYILSEEIELNENYSRFLQTKLECSRQEVEYVLRHMRQYNIKLYRKYFHKY